MDYRVLRCFIALAEELHFGRAARKAHISQPGLSGQIRRLEERLGGPLFERTTRHVNLTAGGHAFLSSAQEAIVALDEGLRAFRETKANQSDRLVIGVTNICAHWGAYDVIARFRSSEPDIIVETREITSVEQETALASGAIDAGFLHPPLREKLRHEVLGDDPLIAAIHRDDPLCERSALRVADLDGRDLVLFPPQNGPALYKRLMAVLAQHGCRPRIGEFATPFTAGLSAVAARRGISLVSSSFSGVLSDVIEYRPISDLNVRIPVAFAWAASQLPRPIESMLRHAQRAVAAS
ncbi:MAG: LysR family transcriptional regulator [Pseudomonadota bacterium]